jgi:ferredoxin
MAFTATQSLASLSVVLGVAAVCLCDLTLDSALAGVEAELSSTLPVEQRVSNVALAKIVYEYLTRRRGDAERSGRNLQDWGPIQERPEDLAVTASLLVDVGFDPPRMAAPSIYALGNSPERHTGNWRQFNRCCTRASNRCWICFVRCPEGAITLDANEYPWWITTNARLFTA